MGTYLLNTLIIVGFLSFILALMGELDFQDAQEEELIYQMMVCEGTWPDYKDINPKCEP